MDIEYQKQQHSYAFTDTFNSDDYESDGYFDTVEQFNKNTSESDIEVVQLRQDSIHSVITSSKMPLEINNNPSSLIKTIKCVSSDIDDLELNPLQLDTAPTLSCHY